MKQKFAAKLWKRTLSTGLSLAMVVTMLPSVSALAADDDAPATLKARSTTGVEGKTFTRNQPFINGITGATDDGEARPFFNAPAFTVKETLGETTIGDCVVPTASNTVLIAAAEGRFDQEKKAGGTDVIAAVSKDKGATWTYSYPLRFPDSEGNAGANATSINNPALVTDADGTIYCLMNITPTGVSSLAADGDNFKYPNVGTGYIEVEGTQRLALTDDIADADQAPSEYAYYVGDWEDATGFAKVMNVDGNTETNYAVDKWYNIYQKNSDGTYEEIMQNRADSEGITHGSGQVQQNVFYAGSSLHVYNTSYIVCVTSADGLEWSAPEILNPYVKKSDGKSLVVAGGKGLRTSQNRLVFPVYRNNDGTNADGTASVIWLDKSTGGDSRWHRSANVPNFDSGDDEGDDNSWIGEGEIVELSDGKLRMVFRNGQGLISYADAERNADNEFVFSKPVVTGTRSPENAHPSVISYMKPIEERKGLLIAAPVGENRTHGRIMTFLATGTGVKGDGEEGAEVGGMTRVEGADVPGSDAYFQQPCIDQFNAGDSIGLLWESGIGRVRFNKFAILDIVKEHYIPHVTVDLDMTVGDVYERTYTVVGQAHMNGVTTKPVSGQGPDAPADESVIKVEFEAGEADQEEIPALFPRATSDDNANGFGLVGDGTISSTFQHTDEAIETIVDQTIEKAEFTITKPFNAEGNEEYVAYAALDRRYLVAKDPVRNFAATRPAENLIITSTPESYINVADSGKIEEGEFAILTTGKNRVNMFNVPKMRFDGQGGWSSNKDQLDGGFTFLQKMSPDEELTGDDAALELIPGYKKVTEITPNEKYLITYIPKSNITRGDYFTDEDITPIFVLYPRNGRAAQTKLVYGTRTVERRAQKHLKITANGPGDATVVANHITYNIHCHEAELEMQKGEKRFFAGYTTNDCSTEDESVAKIANFTLKEPSLFNCNRAADPTNKAEYGTLVGYSTEANTDIDMSAAEFVFRTAEGGENYYTIQGVTNDKYLVNTDGSNVFGDSAITHEVARITDQGTEAFEIRRKSNDNKNNRYLYFYYGKMAFDAVTDKNATDSRYNKPFTEVGDTGFELLEKQDYPSDLDQIEGYRRVTTITSGKRYLITQTYSIEEEDGEEREVRFVLYPENGIPAQSKLYEDVETDGVQVTAVGNVGDTTNITIGENTYPLTITAACDHAGYGRYRKGAVEVSCTKDGYEGDLYCENCDEKVSDGAIIAAGHDVPDASWHVEEGDAPSFTEDGQYTGICSRCGETVTKPYTSLEFATEQLEGKVKEARAIREADYTAKSYAPLKAALDKVETVENTAGAKKTLYDELDAAISGLENQNEFNAAKSKLKEKLLKIKEALTKEEAVFDPAVWTALNTAVNELKAAAIGIDLTALADADAIEAKLDTMELTVLNTAWEKVENVSTNTIEEEQEAQKRAQLKSDIKTTVNTAKPIVNAGQGNYTDDSWKKLTDAYAAANLSDSALEAKTTDELEELLDNLTNALENMEEDNKTEEAKEEVDKAIQAADAIVGAGQKDYSKDSWEEFIKAYNAAKNAAADADAETLKKLADDLVKAQQNLKKASAEIVLVKGYTEDINGIRYEVIDAGKKTVAAKLGLNKKAKSINIPAAVTMKGVSCNVVQISDKAFQSYSKATKLTIGANVTSIGAKAFFKCKKLKKVTISGTAPAIKKAAFKKTASKVTVKAKKLNKKQKKAFLKVLKKTGKISSKSVVK